MRRTNLRASALVAVALLAGTLTASPTGASSPTSANLTAGGVIHDGVRYAKQGDALTLAVSAPQETECVRLSGYRDGERKTSGSEPSRSAWAFSVSAGSEVDGPKTITATSYSNRGCQSASGSGTASFVLDNTVPTLSGAATAAPNAAGWYKDDVIIAWTAGDAGSGVASAPTNSTVPGEGSNLSATRTVSDRVGNEKTTTVSGIKIDRVAPTTSHNAPTAWRNGNVTVTLSPSDALSGVASTHYNVDGGATQTGTTVHLSDEGEHRIQFWSADAAGNTEAPQTVTVDIDKTAPTISAQQNPAKNAAGWNATDVTVTFTCADPAAVNGSRGSGVDSCSAPVEVTAEGVTSVPGTAADAAGNQSSTGHSVSVDKTNPTVTPVQTFSGWHNTPQTVDFTCADPNGANASGGSGVATCSSAHTFNEGANQSHTGSVTDVAGNAGSVQVTGVDVDLTKPETQAAGIPSGWSNANVEVTLTANDQAGLSGVDATYYTLNGGLLQAYTTPFTLTDDGATTLEFWSVDHAGNVEVAKIETVRIDKTVPTALCDPIPTGWSNENVTLNCVASDTGGSELSDPNPAAFSLSTNVAAGSEDANASTGTMALSDGAGNPGTAGPYTGIRVDRRAPTGIAFVNAPSRVTQGSVFPTVDCTAEDGGSDLASCTVTGQNTSDLGDHSLTATAVDNVGNQSAATHTYTVEAPAPSCTVAAEFHGAVKPAMRNQVQAGRVVPVQIAVTCGGAAVTGLTPAIRLLSGDQAEDASFASPATTTQTVSSADTGGEMRPNSTGYIYNLQMPPTAKAGDTFTIAVRPRTGDQSLTALVQIRK